MTEAEAMMRQALDLFAIDPPDSDFQKGYLCALMIFAKEALGFASNDPALAQCENLFSNRHADAFAPKRFGVIDGGKSEGGENSAPIKPR